MAAFLDLASSRYEDGVSSGFDGFALYPQKQKLGHVIQVFQRENIILVYE